MIHPPACTLQTPALRIVVSSNRLLLMSRALLGVLLLIFPVSLRAQPAEHIDADLQTKLEGLIDGFRGDVGIYARHLPSGRAAAIEADTLFPTASMIKVPILLKTFDLLERGDLAYDQKLVYRDSLLYAGEDLLGSFKDGEAITLSKVVMLMITTSDNEGFVLLREVSRLLWHHFEPGSDWQPAEGAGRY